MGVNIGFANAQGGKLKEYATRLQEAKTGLHTLKASLHQGWQAEEIRYINNAIENMERELEIVIKELRAVGSDVSSIANEIKREEEEKAATLAALQVNKN